MAIERALEPLAVDDRVAFDLMIAATAHAHGAHLLTRNAADLRGIEDLVDIDTNENR